jgi:SAM-dependent methyltransferase
MNKLPTLDQIGLKYKSDKSSNFHNYLNLYDGYLNGIRFKYNNILEIGILNGDSLNIFSDYFENSRINAFDIIDKSHLSIKHCNILIGDQSDRNFLNTISNDEFDLILDDGSHKMEHQQISIGVLFRYLKFGGIYIIEDLHTSLPDYIETIIYGKSLFGLNDNCDNSTLNFLKSIKSNNAIINRYLSDEELNFLINNIESVEVFETAYRDNHSRSITSIIKKRSL